MQRTFEHQQPVELSFVATQWFMVYLSTLHNVNVTWQGVMRGVNENWESTHKKLHSPAVSVCSNIIATSKDDWTKQNSQLNEIQHSCEIINKVHLWIQDKVYHRHFVPNLQNKIPMNQTGENIQLNNNNKYSEVFYNCPTHSCSS